MQRLPARTLRVLCGISLQKDKTGSNSRKKYLPTRSEFQKVLVVQLQFLTTFQQCIVLYTGTVSAKCEFSFIFQPSCISGNCCVFLIIGGAAFGSIVENKKGYFIVGKKKGRENGICSVIECHLW